MARAGGLGASSGERGRKVEIADDAVSQLLVPELEKPSVSPGQAAAPLSAGQHRLLLLLGELVLAELAWLSAIGYFVYWLLS